MDSEWAIPPFRVDEAAQRTQIERLAGVRRRRDGARVSRILTALEGAARGGENLMPPLVEAVDASASLGEIAATLVRVFGEYREGVAL